MKQNLTKLKEETTVMDHLTSVRRAIMKKSTCNTCWRGCEEREPSYTVDGNVNWCSHQGEKYGGPLKKQK